jgi:L-aspartate oxidase
MNTDVLVIGSGIAGLNFARLVAEKNPSASITVLSKDGISTSASSLAQGGIAAVTGHAEDSFESHVNDTLVAGRGLCDRNVVELVVRDGPRQIDTLLSCGAQFDTDGMNHLHLAREGGHSTHRVVHHADSTGAEVVRTLVNAARSLPNILILEHHFATDLLMENGVCTGAEVLDLHQSVITSFHSKVTYLATGGAGQVFRCTTNPLVATGDGIAMAIRAGAVIRDLQHYQFHPTAFYSDNRGQQFLITEAVRGAGGRMRNANGALFMHLYDARGDLAPRDVVSKAIRAEMLKSGSSHVFLDCTGIPEAEMQSHFPGIVRHCRSHGIDPASRWIPVSPAAHYCCGGVETDTEGRTSIAGLYAGGECARTGLHGANRLASNSLLEAMVFSTRSAAAVGQVDTGATAEDPDDPVARNTSSQQAAVIAQLRTELQDAMELVSVICTPAASARAVKRLQNVCTAFKAIEKTDALAWHELRNLIDVAESMLQAMRVTPISSRKKLALGQAKSVL